MKLIDYILKFSFGLVLGVVLVFKGSPMLFKQAKELSNETFIEEQFVFFNLDCLTPDNYSYIRLRANLSNGISVNKIYNVSEDKSCLKLVDILLKKEILYSKKLNENLPLTLTNKQINSLGEIKINLGRKNNVKKIIIDDVYILGTKSSIVKIGFVYFLGTMIFILGLLSLIITMIILFKNIHIYSETKKLPELPNTVENKINGFEFLIKYFKR